MEFKIKSANPNDLTTLLKKAKAVSNRGVLELSDNSLSVVSKVDVGYKVSSTTLDSLTTGEIKNLSEISDRPILIAYYDFDRIMKIANFFTAEGFQLTLDCIEETHMGEEVWEVTTMTFRNSQFNFKLKTSSVSDFSDTHFASLIKETFMGYEKVFEFDIQNEKLSQLDSVVKMNLVKTELVNFYAKNGKVLFSPAGSDDSNSTTNFWNLVFSDIKTGVKELNAVKMDVSTISWFDKTDKYTAFYTDAPNSAGEKTHRIVTFNEDQSTVMGIVLKGDEE